MASLKNTNLNPLQHKETPGFRLFLLKQLLIKCDAEFCLELELNPEVLPNLEIGRVTISDQLCRKIEGTYGVNKEWLLKGKGNIFALKGPKAQFVSLTIDSKLDYRDHLFIPLVSMLMDPEATEIEIQETIKNMSDKDQLRDIKKKEKMMKPQITPITQIKEEKKENETTN